MQDRQVENFGTKVWDIPLIVKEQIGRLRSGFRDAFGSGLVGVYVHGSLALGGFNPERSDIDLLAVVRAPLPVAAKRRAAELLLSVSGQPRPVEVTVVIWGALQVREHPMALEFHYSEMWRSQYEDDLASGAWQNWNSRDLRDPDLAGQVAVAAQHGLTLCGEPAGRVLPLPLPHHTADSFLQDCDGALDEIASDPVYGVLNPLRTLFYLQTGRLVSKAEAGQWARKELPLPFQQVISQALAQYAGGTGEHRPGTADTKALAEFVEYLRERISHARVCQDI